MNTRWFLLALSLLFVFPGCGEKKEAAAPQAPVITPQVVVDEKANVEKTDADDVVPAPTPAAAPVKTEPAKEFTGSGSIKGSIFYEGPAPEPTPFATGADPVCAKYELFSEELLVNKNNTLKNVFVYIKEGLEGKTFATPSTPAVMDQRECHYAPHVFGFQTGQTLEIVNSDPTLHNVHGTPDEGKEFNVGMPLEGMKVKKVFETKDVIRFKCDVHPWMSAYAGVLPHPYFKVTGEDGSFEIKDIPSGEYLLGVWQEKFGEQERRITVTNGSAETFDFTYSG